LPTLEAATTCTEKHTRKKKREARTQSGGSEDKKRGVSEREDTGWEWKVPENHCLLLLGSSLGLHLGDRELDVHTGLDRDGGDVLDRLSSTLDVDDALVDVHGETIPGLGTLTARGLAGGEAEVLGGHATRTTDSEALLLGRLDEGGADLLDVGDVQGGERDTDTLHLGLCLCDLLGGSGSRHFWWVGRKRKEKRKSLAAKKLTI